jgi:hypothetical protein
VVSLTPHVPRDLKHWATFMYEKHVPKHGTALCDL